jgi:hypothetical protein
MTSGAGSDSGDTGAERAAAGYREAGERAAALGLRPLVAPHCMGEYGVGRRIWAVSRRTSGPLRSVSANFASRS